MKFKIYEVTLEWNTGKDDDTESFLYAEYEDAVAKLKELVEKQKKVDWIEEGLAKDSDEIYHYELYEEIDHWHFSVDYFFSHMYSSVTIIEREVF